MFGGVATFAASSVLVAWRMRRFTLVELMIVVAIIAILGAIAVPLLSEMQLRSKWVEVATLTQTSGEMYVAYVVDGNAPPLVTTADASPRKPDAVDKELAAWKDVAWATTIGFEPDGAVRCTYLSGFVNNNLHMPSAAICNLDGDKRAVQYMRRYLGATKMGQDVSYEQYDPWMNCLSTPAYDFGPPPFYPYEKVIYTCF